MTLFSLDDTEEVIQIRLDRSFLHFDIILRSWHNSLEVLCKVLASSIKTDDSTELIKEYEKTIKIGESSVNFLPCSNILNIYANINIIATMFEKLLYRIKLLAAPIAKLSCLRLKSEITINNINCHLDKDICFVYNFLNKYKKQTLSQISINRI